MSDHVAPGPCYCGCSYRCHSRGDCSWCSCEEYVEHAAYIQALDTLDTDDHLADDHGLRDNRAAARHIARRRTA